MDLLLLASISIYTARVLLRTRVESGRWILGAWPPFSSLVFPTSFLVQVPSSAVPVHHGTAFIHSGAPADLLHDFRLSLCLLSSSPPPPPARLAQESVSSLPFLIRPSSCPSLPYTPCAWQWACPELDTQPLSAIQYAVSSELYNHMWVTFFAISVLRGSQGKWFVKTKTGQENQLHFSAVEEEKIWIS